MTRRRMGAKFTMLPDAWDYQLAKIKADGCTYRVAIYLLRESWRVDNNRVKLPNGVLKERGVGRWGKQRVLTGAREGRADLDRAEAPQVADRNC
jgi:hypothetical protein